LAVQYQLEIIEI